MKVEFELKKSSKIKEKERKLRQEASRLSSLANKRLKRMEEKNLLESPAYKKWVEEGGVRFGIRGKSKAEVQREVRRLNNFLKHSTSTVSGAKSYFKNVANSIGVTKWDDFKDLQNKLNTFFELSSKVKEYLQNSKEVGVAIGYQKVWEVVAEYVEELSGDVNDIEDNILEVAEKVIESAGYGKIDSYLDEWMNNIE